MAALIEIEHNGASVTVGPTTPRSLLVKNVLSIRVSEFYDAWAEELGIPRAVLDDSVSTFIRISAPIISSKNLDFEPLTLADFEADIKRKWALWLDSGTAILFQKVRLAITGLDNPNPPAKSPPKLPDDAPKV